jgi:hypothetical protein
MSDLFGLEGTALLDRLSLPAPYRARVGSLRRLIDALEGVSDLLCKGCGLILVSG